MSIVSLVCPKCGGSMEVDEFSSHTRCTYCNTEHIVRKEGQGAIQLEYHARCPVCRRNDMVQAITVIQRENTAISEAFAPPERPVEANVPRELEKSEVVGGEQRNTNIVFIIIALLWLGAMCNIPKYEHSTLSIFAILGALGLITWAYIRWHKYYTNKINSKYEHIANSRERDREETVKENKRLITKWKSRMNIWKRLYYCRRDDCVFLPGEDACCSPEDIERYIDEIMTKSKPDG
jgi:hypothetical protein